MGLQVEECVWEKAGWCMGGKGSGVAGRETVSWMAVWFTDTGARKGICCSNLAETLCHLKEGYRASSYFVPQKGTGKTGNHLPQALGDIYCNREEVLSSKCSAGKKINKIACSD